MCEPKVRNLGIGHSVDIGWSDSNWKFDTRKFNVLYICSYKVDDNNLKK